MTPVEVRLLESDAFGLMSFMRRLEQNGRTPDGALSATSQTAIGEKHTMPFHPCVICTDPGTDDDTGWPRVVPDRALRTEE